MKLLLWMALGGLCGLATAVLTISTCIRAVGEGVTDWRPGDEVCALLSGGGYAEQVVVPAGQVLPVPARVDVTTAAAFPETACTVYANVFQVARLTAGETLLVHGGGGSATVWAPLMSELTRYRLLAVDRPGSGMSDAFDYGGVDLRRHAVAFIDHERMAEANRVVVLHVFEKTEGIRVGKLPVLFKALAVVGPLHIVKAAGVPAVVPGKDSALRIDLAPERVAAPFGENFKALCFRVITPD